VDAFLSSRACGCERRACHRRRTRSSRTGRSRQPTRIRPQHRQGTFRKVDVEGAEPEVLVRLLEAGG
jgi:hypothetical protein